MKKWLLVIPVLLITAWFFLPNLLWLVGKHTTNVMVYNGNEETVTFSLNGQPATLAPGEAQVYRSSRFKNHLEKTSPTDAPFTVEFGTGQHVINLGIHSLKVREAYFEWMENKQKFRPYETKPKEDQLLFDSYIEKGIRTLDTCYDCGLILPPKERPYKFLVPSNKGKRIFVSSIL